MIVILIILIPHFIDEAETDERPRARFNTAPCNELNAIPVDQLVEMIEHLSRGPTLDGDEKAILRLFGCLPCDRLSLVWNSPSVVDSDEGLIGSRLLYDFDGEEFDSLIVRAQQCGLMRFDDFDDDAALLFINSNDCAVFARLSNADIRTLLLALFADTTDDDDENAILKLIRCLPLYRVHDLMELPGLSYDDFDEEVDGAQWTRLSRILNSARYVWDS